MGETVTSYADFADNDYLFFHDAYNRGMKGTPMAALGQSICERYLKHVINEYANPETMSEQSLKENILKTHNLQRLCRYIVFAK